VAGFLGEFGHAAGRVVAITPEAPDALLQHDWPGNVRELRNVIERATIVCEDGSIRREDLSLRSASPAQVDSISRNSETRGEGIGVYSRTPAQKLWRRRV
jgi:DNA-binding NtrC family response regulator